jgi:hypothetical protein
MVFRTSEDGRRAAKLSPVGRDPAACGRASWAKRSPEERARRTQILLAAANPQKSGAGHAALFADERYKHEWLLAAEIGRLRARDRREGRSEVYYRIIPYNGFIPPAGLELKQPGRRRRKRQQQLEP